MQNRRGASQVRRRVPSGSQPRAGTPVSRRVSGTRALSSRSPRRKPGLEIRLTRRTGVIAGLAVLLVLGFVTGFVPGLFGGPGASAPAASSPAPAGRTAPPFSYLRHAPSLDGAVTTQTRSATVTISGAVPPELAGVPGYKVRLYVAKGDGEATRVKDASIGKTALFVIKSVKLGQGRNTFSATIIGPDGEGIASDPVTFILDTAKPKISFSDPADGTTVNHKTVDISGRTQADSLVEVRNPANRATASAKADAKGTFTVSISIVEGANALVVSATDPAGNVGSAPLTVIGGTGRLRVQLTASSNRLSRAQLPSTLTLTALALDPDGNPLPGADVVFSLTLAGLPPFTDTGKVTDAAGRATFETTIPAGTATGKGSATAEISSGPYGDATTQISISIGP